MLDPSTSVVVPLVASLSLSEPTDYSLRVAPELLSQFFEFLATDIYGRQALLAASRVCRQITTSTGITLLSLPNELIEQIADGVAPNGGRRAGNLRLVCRRLANVAAPVVWASLHLPADTEIQTAIVAVLIRERERLAKRVKSVRYQLPLPAPEAFDIDALSWPAVDLAAAMSTWFPHLSRLHVDETLTTTLPYLPIALWDSFSHMPALQTLVLDRLNLENAPHPIKSPLKALDRLTIRGCQDANRITLFDTTNPFVPIPARTFELVEQVVDEDDGDVAAMWLLVGCLSSAEIVRIHFSVHLRTRTSIKWRLGKATPRHPSRSSPVPSLASASCSDRHHRLYRRTSPASWPSSLKDRSRSSRSRSGTILSSTKPSQTSSVPPSLRSDFPPTTARPTCFGPTCTPSKPTRTSTTGFYPPPSPPSQRST